ncbi:carbohydrate esterase family 16 protein [Lanmaoa asiatica]|nr:carbohydrate esterase family 16 protein [Lanmaoa asiatica]
MNASLNLNQYKTIVSFGFLHRWGGWRSFDEDIASDMVAHLMDYAWSSAVTNITLWPNNPYPHDFIMQTSTSALNNADWIITTTSSDWEDSFNDSDHLLQAAQDLGQINLLSKSPTNAKNFLVTDAYGRGTQDDWGQAWIQAIYDGSAKFRTQNPSLNVAFVKFATIWDGVHGPDPGYQAFGYTNTSACVGASICDEPEHYFYWNTRGHEGNITSPKLRNYYL